VTIGSATARPGRHRSPTPEGAMRATEPSSTDAAADGESSKHDSPRPPEARTISVVTLGCPKNLADSESMLGQLHRAGYRMSGDPAEAELVVVNTCAFLTASQEESIATILEMAKLKETGRLERLVVAGCLAQRHGASLLDEIPEIDFLIGPGTISQVVDVAAGLLGGGLERGARLGGLDAIDFDWEPRVISGSRRTAYLKISEGCNNTCTFCIIPQLRGKHRSRSIEDIEREARRLVESGIEELVVIAQDTTSYGLDLYGKFSLDRLLERLDSIAGVRWIRLLYTYPRYWTDELVACFGRLERLTLYVDMPIQHASDPVLRRMKRGMGWARTSDLLQRLRAIPQMVLRSTVITGFPGETEADVEALLAALREVEFDHLGAFAYSTEDSTPAGAMEEQLPEEVRAERRDRVLTQQRAISLRRNRARVRQAVEVLVESVDLEQGMARGRWQGQAPEIDGETRLVWSAGTPPPAVGEFVPARVRAAGPYDLVAVKEEVR